jgi:hypothetical protein
VERCARRAAAWDGRWTKLMWSACMSETSGDVGDRTRTPMLARQWFFFTAR